MKKAIEKSVVYLDIMMGGRFVRQLAYEFCPLFPIEAQEVKEYVERKCPSLQGKAHNINFSNQRV